MKKSQIALIGIFSCIIVISIAIIILFFTVFNKEGNKIQDISHYTYLKFDLNSNGYSAKVAKADNLVLSEPLNLPEKVSFENNIYEIVEIADNGFANCGATSIKIPSTVKRIGNKAFYNCDKVKGGIELPSGLTYIGDSAFEGCTFEGNVFIPSTVAYIGTAAYKNCVFEGTVTLPTSIEKINPSTFEGCSKMKGRIDIPSNVKTVCARAFYNCNNMFQLTLTDGLTSIEEAAFYGCGMKGEVNIPTSIRRIEAYTFYGCSEMINLHFSNTTEYIGEHAFENCSNLLILTIPNSIKEIKSSAFGGCVRMERVLINSSSIFFGLTEAAANGGIADYSHRLYIYVHKDILNVGGVPPYIDTYYRRTSDVDNNYPDYIIFSNKEKIV